MNRNEYLKANKYECFILCTFCQLHSLLCFSHLPIVQLLVVVFILLLLFFLSCTVMCPPNDILGSVYSMADMYRSRKMIETRSEIIISAVAMTVTYSTIGSREICTCYWFFYLLYFFAHAFLSFPVRFFFVAFFSLLRISQVES